MMEKAVNTEINLSKNSNFRDIGEKPLTKDNRPLKVDINVLKARAQKLQEKEYKKNIIIFFTFLIASAAAGIYFSL